MLYVRVGLTAIRYLYTVFTLNVKTKYHYCTCIIIQLFFEILKLNPMSFHRLDSIIGIYYFKRNEYEGIKYLNMYAYEI